MTSPPPSAAHAPGARPAPPEPPASAAQETPTAWWPWWVGAAAMLAVLAALALRRRHAGQAVDAGSFADTALEPVIPPAEPSPTAPPLPAPLRREPAMLTRPAPSIARPWIEIDVHPRRGGLNMISATVELEITLSNTGNAAAAAVLVEAVLLPARSGQDEELSALFARPVARPAAPAFALAPGEERRLRVVAALALAGVEPLVARGRAMLVPVVAINAVYRWADMAGQTAGAFVVGVEREGQAKLAPFWLDAPKMHEQLDARPHTLVVRR